MKLRILLTTNNSPWGIILNPVSDNVYKHILSFDDIELKDNFINQELFDDENYKELFDTKTNSGSSLNNELTARLKIAVADYPTNTIDELVNKDYAVIRIDDSENDTDFVYKFYALTNATRDGAYIEYDGELDVFFTYDIKDIFNNNQVNIIRAHVDRFTEDLQNYHFNDPHNRTLEPALADFNQRLPKRTQAVSYSSTGGYIDNGFVYFYFTADFVQGDNIRIADVNFTITGDYIELPYKVIVAPFDAQIRNIGGTDYPWSAQEILDKYKGDEKLLNYHTSPISPFRNLIADDNVVYYAVDGIALGSIQLIQIKSNVDTGEGTTYTSTNSFPLTEIDPNISSLDPENPRSWKKEAKLYNYPFSAYKIKNLTDDGRNIHPEYLGTNLTMSLLATLALAPEAYKQTLQPNFTDQVLYEMYDSKIAVLGFDYTIAANYKGVLNTEAWKSYVQNHGNSMITGAATTIAGGVAGAAAAGALFATGRVIAGTIATLGTAIATTSKMASNYAQRKDYKDQPDKTNNADTIFQLDLAKTQQKDYFIFEQIDDADLKQLADFFYQFGSSFLESLNINDWLKTRYWFNYIEATETFNNIKLPLSSRIKQLINNSVEAGLTIWNVRDLETWRGIKNYSRDNVEMSYLSLDLLKTQAKLLSMFINIIKNETTD